MEFELIKELYLDQLKKEYKDKSKRREIKTFVYSLEIEERQKDRLWDMIVRSVIE